MRTYVLAGARFATLAPGRPELMARHVHEPGDSDITLGVWRTRRGLAYEIRRQERRAPRYDDWTPLVPLEPGEGYAPAAVLEAPTGD